MKQLPNSYFSLGIKMPQYAWKKYTLLIFGLPIFFFYLWMMYLILTNAQFPIEPYNMGIAGGEYFFLREEAILRSIFWYGTLAGVFLTFPLYISKKFHNQLFYKFYKYFWILVASIFSLLTIQFMIEDDLLFNSFVFCVCFLSTLILTLGPAFYQNRLSKE